MTEPDPSPEALELVYRIAVLTLAPVPDVASANEAARLIDAWRSKQHEACVHCGDPMGRGDDACWSCYSTTNGRADFAEQRAEAAEAEVRNAQNEASQVRRHYLHEKAGRDAAEARAAKLQAWVDDLQSGMYVNCVYCGFRYGPGETTPVTMADALKAHIEQCPQHPMAALRARAERYRALLERALLFLPSGPAGLPDEIREALREEEPR